MKLLEHVMKFVERVLERRIRTPVNLNKMQEEYQKDKKLYMCFVDMEKVFDRVPRKKKGLSEVIVWAAVSLYQGAKTRVSVGSAYAKKFQKLVYIKDLCCRHYCLQ